MKKKCSEKEIKQPLHINLTLNPDIKTSLFSEVKYQPISSFISGRFSLSGLRGKLSLAVTALIDPPWAIEFIIFLGIAVSKAILPAKEITSLMRF